MSLTWQRGDIYIQFPLIDVSELGTGFQIIDVTSGNFFALVSSNATVDHVTVESVLNRPDLRWVFTGQNINTGSGGGNQFLNSTPSVYASPVGDDSNGGKAGAPVQTLYRATQIAIALGGANIYFAADTAIGGPVPGQGLWLRGDGIVVPGFLNVSRAPLRYFGLGNDSGVFIPFQPPGCASFIGSDQFDFTKPAFWLVGTEFPIEMHQGMSGDVNGNTGVAAPVRIGWDYVRRNDASLEALSISSASRAAGSTTFTVDLTTATAYAILSASRTANVVTASVQLGSNQVCTPWLPGTPIRIVTSDANFPSIDVVVTSQSDTFSGAPGAITTVTYAQAGSNVSSSPVTGGTIRSHGCQTRERIAVLPTDPSGQFVQSCMMRVLSATIDTIVVSDPYGYAPRSATASGTNVGTLVKQERARHSASATTFHGCTFSGYSNNADLTFCGPTVDLGSTDAHPLRFFDCYFQGFSFPTTTDLTNLDLDRTKVALLADPGASVGSGATFEAYRTQSINGGVRWYTSSTNANALISDWLQDSGGATSPSFPVFAAVEGNPFCWIAIDRAFCADSTTLSSVQLCAGLDPMRVHVGLIDSIESLTGTPSLVSDTQVMGPTNLRSGLWNTVDGVPKTQLTPWQARQLTTWPGGLTTPHVGINRTFGALSARIANIFDPVSNWQAATPFPSGVTVTQSSPAPDGSNNAIKIHNANGAVSHVIIGGYPHTYSGSVGDHVFLGAWMNLPAGIWVTPNLALSNYDSTVLYDSNANSAFSGSNNLWLVPPLANAGWQWVSNCARVTTLTSGHYAVTIDVPPGDTYIYAPTLVWVPQSVANDVDASEFCATLKHQPIYLQPGMSGTMEGGKFLAHGGLGIDASVPKVAGSSSGQLTVGSITTYEPRYAADGVTIIGWAPLYAATVNP